MKNTSLISVFEGAIILLVLLTTPVTAQPGPTKYVNVVNEGSTYQALDSTFPKPWKYTMNITAKSNTTVYMLAYTNVSLTVVVYNQSVGTVNVTFKWEFQGPIQVFTKIQNPNPTDKANVTWYEETTWDEGGIPGPSGTLVAGAIAVGLIVVGFQFKRRKKLTFTP